MATTVIGVGSIGKTVAQLLVSGKEPVVLASRDASQASALAEDLGDGATSATSVREAITQADTVVFAVWFDTMKELIAEHADLLAGKVVIDPSNPISLEGGKISRILPDGQSAGEVIASLLPSDAHFAKAFGTLNAGELAGGAHRTPQPAVLFYATDDDQAAAATERLITAAGFTPVKAGGVTASLRIEVFGDLHTIGGLNGKLVSEEEAKAAVAA
ncbi:NADPH-dependent F420 reductase [Streptomyces violaceusniger]|uniref:NADP oxidoreductase n=1 Tax=Streptomyces violaceusniger TaxID=68280 RepID=A0A4D4LGG7_STRVO|nr:NADP oxidoreductase [Streptomyces violaceusniger]